MAVTLSVRMVSRFLGSQSVIMGWMAVSYCMHFDYQFP